MRLSDGGRWCNKVSDFETQLARGRAIERAVARWLQARGSLILPVYDYSGLGEGKAPKLEAFTVADSLVTPDLLVARRGVLVWVEVKYKHHADLTRKTGLLETGISLRLWREYHRVREVSGTRVFLAFAHESEDVLTCDEIETLCSLSPREYDGPKMGRGGMVFWPLSRLHRIASFAEVCH